jgi:hypothetical protein
MLQNNIQHAGPYALVSVKPARRVNWTLFVMLVAAIMSAFFVGLWTGATQTEKPQLYDHFEPLIKQFMECPSQAEIWCSGLPTP